MAKKVKKSDLTEYMDDDSDGKGRSVLVKLSPLYTKRLGKIKDKLNIKYDAKWLRGVIDFYYFNLIATDEESDTENN